MTTSELTALLNVLAAHRRHVLGILDGLTDEALRRSVLPTGWSPLALVGHLTDNERFWFEAVLAGRPDVAAELDEAGGWVVPADVPAAAVLDGYRRATATADAIVRECAPEDPLGWWPEDLFGGWRLDDVRQLLLHVIGETATHAGHLDAARELIDGTTWLILD